MMANSINPDEVINLTESIERLSRDLKFEKQRTRNLETQIEKLLGELTSERNKGPQNVKEGEGQLSLDAAQIKDIGETRNFDQIPLVKEELLRLSQDLANQLTAINEFISNDWSVISKESLQPVEARTVESEAAEVEPYIISIGGVRSLAVVCPPDVAKDDWSARAVEIDGPLLLMPNEVDAQHALSVVVQPLAESKYHRSVVTFTTRDIRRIKIRIRPSKKAHDSKFSTIGAVDVDLKRKEVSGTLESSDSKLVLVELEELPGGWLRLEIGISYAASDPLEFIMSMMNSNSKSNFSFPGSPGQFLFVSSWLYASDMTAPVEGGTSADFLAEFETLNTEGQTAGKPVSGEAIPVVLQSRERFADAFGSEITNADAVGGGDTPAGTQDNIILLQAERDLTPPLAVGGKIVSPMRWKKLAAERYDKELSFLTSGEYDRVMSLAGKHEGKRAFLIGNGPSIQSQDLTLLRNEITFCANWFVNHRQFSSICPKYYCVSSHEMFGGWGSVPELNKDFQKSLSAVITDETNLFFSYKFANYLRSEKFFPLEQIYYLIFDRPKLLVDEIGDQNFDLSRCMDDAYTVLLTFCVPLAVHFGITELYLVGCDCDYGLTAPSDPKAYFYPPEQHTSSTTRFESLQRIWTPGGPIFRSYEVVADAAQKKGLKMYNATLGGKLEVLPRVRYESLFE